MSYPDQSNQKLYEASATYSSGGTGIWGKVADTIGKIASGVAHYAGEALPYLAEAATAYAAGISNSKRSLDPSGLSDNTPQMLYQAQNVRMKPAPPVKTQPVSISKLQPLGQMASTRIQALRTHAEKQFEASNQKTLPPVRLQLALSTTRGPATREQTKSVTPLDATPSRMLPPPKQARANQNSARRGAEPPSSIPGAQTPVSYAQLYQAAAKQSSMPADFNFPKYQKPLKSPPTKPQPSSISLSAVSKAFTGPSQDLMQQAKESRLSEANLGQVELNLDLLKSAKLLTPEHYDPLAMQTKALFGLNWLQHDGHFNNDGIITYRGIQTPAVLAPLLAYADADRYWKTDTHIRPEENWQQSAWKTAPEFVRAVFLNPTQGDTWLQVLYDWYFETGPAKRFYDASHPITRDLMKDEGVQQKRKEWIKAGKPNQYLNKIYKFGVKEYVRELLTLDGTGSLLGSYRVSIERQPNKLIKYTVENVTGWKSGTHLPPIIRDFKQSKAPKAKSTVEGMLLRHQPITIPESILEDRKRSEAGPGGNLVQKYFWYEKD